MAKKPPTFQSISKILPHRINPPNLVCASVLAAALRINVWIFYFQTGSRGTGGATSPTTLQCTQPKVDQPNSLLWWAKPLKTKLICKNKQRVAPFRQSGSRAILGGQPLGRSASWKRKKKLRLRSSGLSRNRREKKHAEHQANVRHFELSRKCRAPLMRARECMSHFVYDLRSWPLVRDQPCTRSRPDHVWSLQIRSDHRPHTLGSGGVPFPEVNLPEDV